MRKKYILHARKKISLKQTENYTKIGGFIVPKRVFHYNLKVSLHL